MGDADPSGPVVAAVGEPKLCREALARARWQSGRAPFARIWSTPTYVSEETIEWPPWPRLHAPAPKVVPPRRCPTAGRAPLLSSSGSLAALLICRRCSSPKFQRFSGGALDLPKVHQRAGQRRSVLYKMRSEAPSMHTQRHTAAARRAHCHGARVFRRGATRTVVNKEL